MFASVTNTPTASSAVSPSLEPSAHVWLARARLVIGARCGRLCLKFLDVAVQSLQAAFLFVYVGPELSEIFSDLLCHLRLMIKTTT